MRRIALMLVLVPVPAVGQERVRVGGVPEARAPAAQAYADPGEVIATELRFARMAQDKGQWTAFRAYAAPGAQMFAPQVVRAELFLKGKPNPAVAVKWQPQAVWSSCDGAYAVTRGAWQKGASQGWFVTVWQRQKDGRYQWVLDQGDELKAAEPAPDMPAPDMIVATVADCPARRGGFDDGMARGRRARGIAVEPFDKNAPTDFTTHAAPDGSLGWTTGMAGGARSFVLRIRQDGELREVLRLTAGGG